MSKDILYGIKYVEIEELDPLTQLPKVGGVKFAMDTAETAELEAVTSEGTEDLKRNDTRILAIVRTPDLLYGYNLTFKDNTFDPEVMALIEGGTVRRQGGAIAGYDSPMLASGAANMKPFRMTLYIPNYVGDSIVNYVKLTLNNCTGPAPGMDYVAELPAVLRTISFDLNGGTGTADALRIETGKKITPKPADPTGPSGKAFKGWKVLGDSTVWDFATMDVPDRDITLVAQYGD